MSFGLTRKDRLDNSGNIPYKGHINDAYHRDHRYTNEVANEN